MNTTLRSTLIGVAIAGGLVAAHVYGPSLHPCTRLEASICEGLGPRDCAVWRERGRPGMPEPRTAFRGRGRNALGDAVFAVVLDWDPKLPVGVCRGLSERNALETFVGALKKSLR